MACAFHSDGLVGLKCRHRMTSCWTPNEDPNFFQAFVFVVIFVVIRILSPQAHFKATKSTYHDGDCNEGLHDEGVVARHVPTPVVVVPFTLFLFTLILSPQTFFFQLPSLYFQSFFPFSLSKLLLFCFLCFY